MRHGLRFIFVLALCSLAAPLTRAQAPPARPAGTGSIEGIVISDKGIPQPNVVVAAKYEGSPLRVSSTTGPDGRFRIDNLQLGYMSLTATSQDGFVMPDISSSGGMDRVLGRGGLRVNVRSGEHVKDIQIEMLSTGVVTGLVLDNQRKPRSSQMISLFQREYDRDGNPTLEIRKNARSDDTGAYRFFDVLPGEYYLVAFDDSSGPSFPIYYPDVSSPEQAVTVKVEAGAQLQVSSFIVTARQSHSIRLTLNGLTTTEGVSFHLIPRVAGGIRYGLGQPNFQNRDGVVTIAGVPLGSYSLLIATTDRTVSGRSVDVDVPDKDVDLGAIALRPRVSIPVRVSYIDGARPLPFVPPQTPSLQSVRPSDPSDLFVYVNKTTNLFEHVAEGKYTIALVGSTLPVVSATYRGHDVFADGMVISTDDMPGTLEVTVGREGTVHGVVRNAKDEPVANARVVLVPDQKRRANPELFFNELSDQTGTFSIVGVIPGDYAVLAWEFTPANAYRNAEWLKEYEARALPVAVGHGTNSVVNLRIIPKAK